ncbi:hypothetical protein ACJX0J_006438, partial [Zea mays]
VQYENKGLHRDLGELQLIQLIACSKLQLEVGRLGLVIKLLGSSGIIEFHLNCKDDPLIIGDVLFSKIKIVWHFVAPSAKLEKYAYRLDEMINFPELKMKRSGHFPFMALVDRQGFGDPSLEKSTIWATARAMAKDT